MKDGKNRFKTYFRREFSSKEECIEYVKYSKEIVVPEGYLVDCEKKSKTIEIDINSDDIGAFIGAKGSNYKRMISEFKKKILNKTTEITSEEWNSIQIKLQFDKT